MYDYDEEEPGAIPMRPRVPQTVVYDEGEPPSLTSRHPNHLSSSPSSVVYVSPLSSPSKERRFLPSPHKMSGPAQSPKQTHHHVSKLSSPRSYVASPKAKISMSSPTKSNNGYKTKSPSKTMKSPSKTMGGVRSVTSNSSQSYSNPKNSPKTKGRSSKLIWKPKQQAPSSPRSSNIAVPRGAVKDRINKFQNLFAAPKDEDLDLSNTGRVNPALKAQYLLDMERQEQERVRQQDVANREALARHTRRRQQAAIRLQCFVRCKQAQKRMNRQRDQYGTVGRRRRAAIRLQTAFRQHLAHRHVQELRRAYQEEQNRLLAEQEQKRQEQAVIPIQACMRSALVRMQVCRMVEQLIADLMEKQIQKEEEKKAQRLQQQQAEEEEAALFQALADQIEQERREEEEQEEERRRRRELLENLQLFEGPLQRQVGRIPEWWMQVTPHATYDRDDFDFAMEDLWQSEHGGWGQEQEEEQGEQVAEQLQEQEVRQDGDQEGEHEQEDEQEHEQEQEFEQEHEQEYEHEHEHEYEQEHELEYEQEQDHEQDHDHEQGREQDLEQDHERDHDNEHGQEYEQGYEQDHEQEQERYCEREQDS